jgi:hypothetical protein
VSTSLIANNLSVNTTVNKFYRSGCTIYSQGLKCQHLVLRCVQWDAYIHVLRFGYIPAQYHQKRSRHTGLAIFYWFGELQILTPLAKLGMVTVVTASRPPYLASSQIPCIALCRAVFGRISAAASRPLCRKRQGLPIP